MAETMESVRTAVEDAQKTLREQWNADGVDVHGQGFTLRWESEVDETVENVHAMVEEMTTISEENPEADVTGRASDDNYNVGVWFDSNEETEEEA